eukprot:6596728-Prymnesium_polylepis.1
MEGERCSSSRAWDVGESRALFGSSRGVGCALVAWVFGLRAILYPPRVVERTCCGRSVLALTLESFTATLSTATHRSFASGCAGDSAHVALRKAEKSLKRADDALALVQSGISIAKSILKVGSAVPLLGGACKVAKDILEEVQASADKVDDVMEAGRRIVDTLKMLEVMATNLYRLGEAERHDLEVLISELQAMLLDVKEVVSSFGTSGWLKRATKLGKHAKTLKKLDAKIRRTVELAMNLYKFANDAAAAEMQQQLIKLVQERFYALEEAVESKVKERASGSQTDVEAAAAALEKDAVALSEVAQRAGIIEEVMLVELQEFSAEVREQYMQIKASIDRVGAGVDRVGAGVDEVRDQLGELKTMMGSMRYDEGGRYEYIRLKDADEDDTDEQAAVLGKGTFGETYQMRHQVDKRSYAVKMISVRDFKRSG